MVCHMCKTAVRHQVRVWMVCHMCKTAVRHQVRVWMVCHMCKTAVKYTPTSRQKQGCPLRRNGRLIDMFMSIFLNQPLSAGKGWNFWNVLPVGTNCITLLLKFTGLKYIMSFGNYVTENYSATLWKQSGWGHGDYCVMQLCQKGFIVDSMDSTIHLTLPEGIYSGQHGSYNSLNFARRDLKWTACIVQFTVTIDPPLYSVSVESVLTSDHLSIICTTNVSKPKCPLTIMFHHTLKAIDRPFTNFDWSP